MRAIQNRVGEKRIANCGMEMEIIAYRKSYDIDVRFEDGAIRTATYNAFKSGKISPQKKHVLV